MKDLYLVQNIYRKSMKKMYGRQDYEDKRMTIKSVGKDEQDVQSERENIRMKK